MPNHPVNPMLEWRAAPRGKVQDGAGYLYRWVMTEGLARSTAQKTVTRPE